MDCREENDNLHGHGHSHGNGHSHNCDHSQDAFDASGNTLYPFIDRDKILCLNEARAGMGKSVIKPWDQRQTNEPYLESDEDDAELLITIPFVSAVNIRSFCIASCEENRGPSKIKLFVNRNDLDFDLARDLKPTQEYDQMTQDFNAAVDYPLLPKKFMGVTSLTLFIPSNFLGEEESTKLSYIGFKGIGTQARRGVVETTYEASAQMKDHKKVEGTETGKSFLS